ncbi:TenA family protein [Corynebacterium sp.]|jgi:thiaminase/transcriptional activator TenA|uniref:TenA family protein n=1 Tax=Corynebacterium sp. TaxID=1720 RepID=UPI0025C63F1A|nr:TenA family protein [Corynebacterium sp.]
MEDYAAQTTTGTPTTRFSDTLREENRTTWEAAATHRFVTELFAGTLPDENMAGYLVQDYRFADGFMALLGAAVATADNYPSRHRFAQFLGEVAGDEDTYFREAAAELDADTSVPDTGATAGFKQLFVDAADTRNYAAILGVLVVCEWLYLDWATRPENRAHGTGENGYPPRHVHAEWVRLHDYPGFHQLIDFLRTEVDRAGERSPEDAALAREYFRRTVDLELQFFSEHR